MAHYGLTARPGSLGSVAEGLAARRLAASDVGVFGPEDHRFEALATHDPEGQPVIIATTMGG